MKHTNKKLIRLTALLLSFLMTVLAPTSYAASLDEMNEQRNALAQRKRELENKISTLAEEEEKKEEYQAVLSEKIKTVETQIDTAIVNIDTLNDSIAELEAALEQAELEIQDTMELLKKRLATLYAAGKVSTLEILFNAESLSDFTMRTELISRITHHDRQLIDQVSEYMETTAAQRTALEEQKTTLAEEKKLLESSQVELESLIAENNALLEQIRSEKGSAQAELQRTSQEASYLTNMIAEYIEEMRKAEEAAKATPTPSPTPTPNPTPNPSAGTEATPTPTPTPNPTPTPAPTPTPEPSAPLTDSFAWPLPGYSYITDTFGGGHYGLDIGAPRGTPIVASRSGTVMTANSTDEWGQSWGYYVSIYHDSSYSTLYAHMSEVAVTSGQWVNKGQVIGYVGNTGYSFGNHLHFEIYQNGRRVDPQKFV